MIDVQTRLSSRFITSTTRSYNGTACIEFNGARDRAGYGIISVGKKNHKAHRISYALFVDDLLPGMDIDHKCVNSSCCNPDHLQQISHTENMKLIHDRHVASKHS